MALVDQVLHVMKPAEWGKQLGFDEKWIAFVDDNMKASTCFVTLFASGRGICYQANIKLTTALPPGSEVEGIVRHGANHWTRTAEISSRKGNGSPKSYFVKVPS